MLDFGRIPYDMHAAAPLRGKIIENLRSVAFMTDGMSRDVRDAYLRRCANWLAQHNDWYHAMVGTAEGRGMHLFYEREVTITGEHILDVEPALRILSQTARQLGYAVSLAFTASYFLERLTQIKNLFDDSVITSLAVQLEESYDAATAQKVAGALEAMIDQGATIGIIGELAEMTRHDLFNSPCLSAANLTWYPMQKAGAALPQPKNPVRNCHSRMRLYIDGAGDIYPCYGLVGLQSGVLGTIEQAIGDTGLNEAPVLDLLDQWQAHGPDVDETDGLHEAQDDALPEMCRRHRGGLL